MPIIASSMVILSQLPLTCRKLSRSGMAFCVMSAKNRHSNTNSPGLFNELPGPSLISLEATGFRQSFKVLPYHPPLLKVESGEFAMKSVSQIVLGTVAAALMMISVGCQPPKPPAPASSGSEATATDNTTGNTTAGSETPAGETP